MTTAMSRLCPIYIIKKRKEQIPTLALKLVGMGEDMKSVCSPVQVLHYDYQHWSKTDSPLPKLVGGGVSRVPCLALETPKGRPSCISTGQWANTGYFCSDKTKT